jgi:ABC-2 type transport system permease protein
MKKIYLKTRFRHTLTLSIKESFSIFMQECKTVCTDKGVIIIFLIASFMYPILYCSIYKNEVLVDVPVAVVDQSHSKRSAALLRQIDASRDVKITYHCTSLQEARKVFNTRKVHGVIFIPSDFDSKIVAGQQATLAIYCDMSSFLYYKALLTSTSYIILDNSKQIKTERLNAQGITGEAAKMVADPIPYDDIILYNSSMGFASFLMPALLIIFIHQTLFFGIGMLAGTAREENRFHVLVSSKIHRMGIYRIIWGKSLCYFVLYFALSFYTLGLIPRIYNLPHIGNPVDIVYLLIPFLFATIFFSMTFSTFFRNRETGMVLFLFFSLILIFLSGISWPLKNIHGFWRAFGWMFPSTQGIQAYVKINSMGATIREVSFEYISLWIQTGVYFLTTTLTYYWQIKKNKIRSRIRQIKGHKRVLTINNPTKQSDNTADYKSES